MPKDVENGSVPKTPLDILSEEQWSEILKAFSAELDMVATLVDPRGNILLHVGDYTDICIMVRKRPQSLTFVCGQTSQALMTQAQRTKGPVIEPCQIGLCKLLIPIFSGEEFIGAVAACSRALAGEELDPFMVAQELGISEQEAESLLSSVPKIEEEKLTDVALYWEDRIKELISSQIKRSGKADLSA